MSVLLALDSDDATDPARAGQKAAVLARLLRAGLPVPSGVVIPADAFESGRLGAAVRVELARRMADLGGLVAARSSSASEDLQDRSAAGLYLTLLDVDPAGLSEAAERVHASGADPAVRRDEAPGEMAVLVQPMLQPFAAGVAFTADPLTGDRETIVVHAVRGQGEALVGGKTQGQEWRVKGSTVERHVVTPGLEVIDEAQAAAVAALARRVAEVQGEPQDVEWAMTKGHLYLLQARPITALPAAVTWDPPPGTWARNVRLGEWLGAPVSPLFESWLLSTIEETMHEEFQRLVGQPAPRPLHVLVNGWYYYSLRYLPATPGAVARTLPGLLVRLVRSPRRVAPVLPPLARFGLDLYVREWREQLLPAYLAVTDRAEAELVGAAPGRLVALVDDLARWAGRYFTSMTFVAGYAWKTEIPLARFWRAHLAGRVEGHPQELLRGLVQPDVAAHGVQSLDWIFPTLVELGLMGDDPDLVPRRARLIRERAALEERARAALPDKDVRRFDRLLCEAQRGAVLRETQIADFTRPWPAMRRALARLGDTLVEAGVIQSALDIHYLRRHEVVAALAGDGRSLAAVAAERGNLLRQQTRLRAPLVLGPLPRMLHSLLDSADRALSDDPATTGGGLRGTPASPGRATGRVRVLRGIDEIRRLEAGDVLVCPVTAPAWASVFHRVAAVVTDVGSPAAHASILAREYGIPAVVGTGDGTVRLQDGWIVTVDGGAGLVTW